jgi:hypothetical protein
MSLARLPFYDNEKATVGSEKKCPKLSGALILLDRHLSGYQFPAS